MERGAGFRERSPRRVRAGSDGDPSTGGGQYVHQVALVSTLKRCQLQIQRIRPPEIGSRVTIEILEGIPLFDPRLFMKLRGFLSPKSSECHLILF